MKAHRLFPFQPRAITRNAVQKTAMLISFFALHAAAGLISLQISSEQGVLIALGKKDSLRLYQQLVPELSDKEYWLKRVFAAKVNGMISAALVVRNNGQVASAALLRSTISDSANEFALLYSIRGWDFGHLDIPKSAIVEVIFDVVFDSSITDATPWRGNETATCSDSVKRPQKSPVQIMLSTEKICLYLEVPLQKDKKRTWNTWGNTEWKLLLKNISENFCVYNSNWQPADSSNYIALDSLFSSDTSARQIAIKDLPGGIAGRLSVLGCSRLVAFYKHRSQYLKKKGGKLPIRGTTHGGFYYSNKSMAPQVNLPIPSQDAVQSIIVSIYDLKTGRGIFHILGTETEISLSDAVETLTKKLFIQMENVK